MYSWFCISIPSIKNLPLFKTLIFIPDIYISAILAATPVIYNLPSLLIALSIRTGISGKKFVSNKTVPENVLLPDMQTSPFLYKDTCPYETYFPYRDFAEIFTTFNPPST